MMRAASFVKESLRLFAATGGLTNGLGDRLRFILRRSRNEAPLELRHQGFPFHARRRDWMGIEEVLLRGEYDEVLDVIRDRSEPTVFDLGANIGSFAVRVFQRFPRAKVVSVEAGPSTFRLLAENAALDRSLAWSVRHAAVSGRSGTVHFAEHRTSTASRIAAGPEGVAVPAVSLGDLLRECGHSTLDLVKMDIEGAEFDALCSDPDALVGIRNLVVEVHTDRIDEGPIYSVLRDRFPRLYRIPGRRSTKPLVLATSATLRLPVYRPSASATAGPTASANGGAAHA